ncbi:SpoIID/LytB domain-containing protein [Oculatella sp. LEGE 06141]|nr:SpoIID/LytB domain-containing protein [Oculatella sp. LEGE 06141]
MTRQQLLKWLTPYRWLLLPVLGIGLGVPLGVVLLSDRPTPSDASIDSPIPAPSTTVAPPIAPSPATPPSPATAPSPSPTSSPTPTAPPALTPEQDAMNRQNIEAFLASRPSIDSLIDMRVAISEGVSSLAIRTSMQAVVFDNTGKQLQTLEAGSTYTAQPVGDAIQLNSSRLPKIVIIDPSPSGLFYLGDRGYRGRLALVADSGNLWGINIVNMRSYLYSVVGSEVSPNWNMEALKAQAIAARSYALTYHFKPVHPAFDLGATQRYQVYSGIAREADTIRQAVDATSGEFVSHRGGVVESLYAASDDIVMEVFQGRGMSQLGALNLANQGYTYQQILSNYYPGTEVGRIEQDMD